MSSKKRKQSLIEDECLACLGYFAYSTGREKRASIVNAFAECTRLDEGTGTSEKRKAWWVAKFSNMQFAFKSLEGRRIHGQTLPVTNGKGLISTEGVQAAIRNGALMLFLQDFDTCIGCAVQALDSNLPADIHNAVFGGVSERGQDLYGAEISTQDSADALSGRKKEGAKKLRKHWYMERDSDLPKAAKAAFRKEHGELFCEICGLLPEPTYGHAIVEAHHRLPLSKYAERQKTHTEPSDFAILCPSCHRAVHKEPDCDMAVVAGRVVPLGVQFRHKI